jgi:hypothetical protein
MHNLTKNNYIWSIILIIILFFVQIFSTIHYPKKYHTMKSLFNSDVLVLFQTPSTKFGRDMIVSQKKLIVPVIENKINNYELEKFYNPKKIRAVVCYIPNKERYIIELKGLYQNFEMLNLWEDTDLIIFYPKDFILSEKSKNNMNKMIMIQYDDVEEGTEWDGPIAADDCKPLKGSKEALAHPNGGCKGGEALYGKYAFINSFKFFIDSSIKTVLSNYRYILKTDADVFLTPRFKNTFPEKKVMVGNGGYSADIKTQKRLKDVSSKLKYNHFNIFNVGATWYGNSEDIIKLGDLSYNATKYIYKNEFLHYHPGWAEWYIGVSSMYGSEIAANHLFGKDKLEKTDLIDNHASSSNDISSVLHVHCWPSGDFYSKSAYLEGKYKDKKPNPNSTQINEYAFNIIKNSESL